MRPALMETDPNLIATLHELAGKYGASGVLETATDMWPRTARGQGISVFRWWKNGDHPDDRVGAREVDVVAFGDQHPDFFDGEDHGPIPADAPIYERLEGAVVRYYRHPSVPGDEIHYGCHRLWHDHGWIDSGGLGRNVCPGDWIIGVSGEFYPWRQPS